MKRKLAASLFITALLVSAARGGDNGDGGDGDGQATNGGGADTVTVGLIPIVDVAPLFLGDQQGFFADRGIELQTEFAAGGAEIIPGVHRVCGGGVPDPLPVRRDV